ncbi:hypothetical protein [Aquamicrobium defluvii]|uniref:Putative flap endonuclease-1-like 5' DNA nuclease n=1 Tax=Aquamicrobium defluvii TaxID=69279 RepID=A0A4R6YLA5_9HYPH|nr:hypothetical protein [Aquamicrobium defluvii]EZQ16622.1 NADH:ubiquinone oxidoreductase [Halopseudomonas bauzanensis]TDR38055.1 putative flap endonuclease-1-like 5' DNA nuclease [Aquamicrobium defluvii]
MTQTGRNHNVVLPAELANSVNLLAHPAAGMAAASALGFGLASQALGVWLGALNGASEASQKLFQTFGDAAAQDEHKAADEAKPAAHTERAAAADVAVQAEAHRPKALDKPSAPDDLKAISGIGPKLEAVLNGYGIWTWRQIAEWTDAEIAWMDETLGFRGRIRRDDWVGQAAVLQDGQRAK